MKPESTHHLEGNTAQENISRSSLFLVGVATTIIVLQFLAHTFISIHPIYSSETATPGNHLCNWILIALYTWRHLVLLLLAAWTGLLLRNVFPSPTRARCIILSAIAVTGLVLYNYGVLTNSWPLYFFGGCIAAAMFQGYMFNPGRTVEHHPVESAAMSVTMAIVCLGLFLLDRHRMVTVFGMMPFVYYMLLLSNSRPVQQCMASPWVKPTVIALSALSFAAAVIGLIQNHRLSFYYLLPVWSVIIQPAVVYPCILLWKRKKK